MSATKFAPMTFDFKAVEKKWQDFWLTNHTYQALNGDTTREKKYILVEFPFPSGANLHVGHVFRYTVPDIYSRFLRQKGYNVLFPMGWDAFGLPAEEYARKTGQNPRITTEQNIAGIKRNIQKMGYGIDWNREFSTTDPEYYKWTQWIFKQFYEQGLAVQKDVELWYCENLGTVLANEEVYDGPTGEKLSERGDHPVEKKKMKQWVLKMPEYAEKLLAGLDQTHFPEHIKSMQRTWIGKSEGVTVDWDLVPRDYIKMVDNYPTFPYDVEFEVKEADYTKFIRERATAFIRIKGTNQYLSYIQNRYADKNWVFLPGGGVDIGETPLQAVIRETREELGLSGLEYVADLGSIGAVGLWTGQSQHAIEHYFLFDVEMEHIKKRVKAEVDESSSEICGHVRGIALEQFKGNNWPHLNHVIQDLEEYLATGKIDRLVQHNRDIVIGTTSKGKIDRWKHQLNITGVNLLSIEDLGLSIGEIVEDGASEMENARIKAKAFWTATTKPSISGDSGLYLEGVPAEEQPGQNTKRAAGVLESDSEEVTWQKMVDFYISKVDKYGIVGELKAYFMDAFSLYDGYNFYDIEVKRPIIITNQITYPERKVFPLCNIYKVPANGKYYYDLSSDEMDEFLVEYREARELLSNYLFDGEAASGQKAMIQTYTTRVDTLPSSTFVVVAPEYSGLLELASDEYKFGVAAYIEQTRGKSERERQINKDKTGVFSGRFVRNPLTNELCPVWVTDFVLGGYGTGAVMGDAHDLRDAELALKYDIYLAENISKDGKSRENFLELMKTGDVFVDDGILYSSGEFNGLTSQETRVKIANKLVQMGKGKTQTNYRMRDFVFSRQRYWGEPFPFEYIMLENVDTILIDAVFCLINKSENGLSLNEELYNYLDTLPQRKIVVTNAKDEALQTTKELVGIKFEVFSLQFDPEKTDPRFYETMIESLGIDINTTIYFDHNDDNLSSARANKLHCFQYKSNQQAISTLNTLFDTRHFTNVIKDDKLPLALPDLEDFEPSKDGRSPLAKSNWINVRDEQGGVIGSHEADTMPNWAGSSWYYLRFTDSKNNEAFASEENLKYWLPVDHYFGGSEHTTLHLLYSRFWHQFLYDMGKVPTPEPYDYRTNGGILLGPDGSKMSKSKGNVIQPDDKLAAVGADALRLYIAFIGPYDATVVWQDGGLKACKTLVDRIWNLQQAVSPTLKNDLVGNKKLYVAYNKFVKSVTGLLEEMKNNVAVAEIMTFTNLLRDTPTIPQDIFEGFIQVVAPFAPHLCEELWSVLGHKTSVALTTWPTFDPELCYDDIVTYAVQVNGKVRADFEIEANATDEQILEKAKGCVEKYLEGKTIRFSKIIPGKLVTLVVG
jgi:leucyl-tRNA synthetase/inosine/xanthosine triphosphate pyrophosphatase family protein/ADP-ribose pyrophosphatase YjhB (NUDIX family)